MSHDVSTGGLVRVLRGLIAGGAVAAAVALPTEALAVTAVNIDKSGAFSNGFTNYVSSEGGTRISIVDILNHVYGTTFNIGLPVGDTNQYLTTQTLSNGLGLSAIRVDPDEVWKGDFIAASAEARFAAYAQKFGYYLGSSKAENPGVTDVYHNLINVTGGGFAVSGSATVAAMGATPFEDDAFFRWARSGDGHTYSSLPADNIDLFDHLVAYEITGLTSGIYAPPDGFTYSVFMLFWEDLPSTGWNDFDYNDLAVEVIRQQRIPVFEETPPVPEPVTVGLSMLGLTSLGLVTLRRRRA